MDSGQSGYNQAMPSKAKDVTTYIEKAPAERQEALRRLRLLRQQFLTSYKETMDYGGPSYQRNGEVEAGFAGQKHFIGLYILRTDMMNAQREHSKARGSV